MEWKDLDANQVEKRVALTWERTQRSLQSPNKFDEYPPTSKVEETNSERKEENSEKKTSTSPN
jgi:hypothetical protein